MIVVIYAVLMIASFVIVTGILALILCSLGADSDDAAKVAFIVMTVINLLYYFYLVVEENPLGLAFQSS
mgnify:CR=1 FL=1|tara:strand:+ start:2539 stop:2745 length:207 start_codon:yes stop_codon:yes gene_type:complete